MSGVIINKPADNTVIFTFTNGSLKVTIRLGDLSLEPCEAIVNPTNESMAHNGGLDTIIHNKMGEFFSDQVTAISRRLDKNACPVGQSRIFVAKFDRESSTAHYVINTVGPRYKLEEQEQAEFHLQSCYHTTLQLANLYSLSSIAYPAISCGAFRFPLRGAARVGIRAIREYSNQVKDVRFVLLELAVYTAFVTEWTEHCERINKEATGGDDRDGCRTPPPPTPPPTAARHCLLCKLKHISRADAHLCTDCFNLTRPELFSKFLQQLRFAAEKSFHHLQGECAKLKPILTPYPLTYSPVVKFDPNIHSRDSVAEHFLQCHCDKPFRNAMPMAIVGDGNCFYNTFVKLGGAGATADASSITSVELRARNIVELVLRRAEYEKKHPSLCAILDGFETYVTNEMVRDGNYVAVWDFLSIPTVLNINVISVYPRVNGDSDENYKKLNGYSYTPAVVVDAKAVDQLKTITCTDVKVLFSNCNKPAQFGPNKEKGWVPNHFVPLLSLR